VKLSSGLALRDHITPEARRSPDQGASAASLTITSSSENLACDESAKPSRGVRIGVRLLSERSTERRALAG